MKKYQNSLLIFCLIGLSLVCQSQNRETNIDSTQFATIYIYRPFSILAPLMGFGIRNDGQKLFRIQNNSVRTIKIYQPKPVCLSAKSVERVSKITIAIELGKSYYVRCKPGISYLSVNPKLLLVDAKIGKQEYEAIVDEK